jgi:putative transcriptional regulator
MTNYLANKLLIAPPKMTDWRFSKSVVYLWKHDQSGAGGVIVNKKVNAPTFENICSEGSIKKRPDVDPIIFYGGPVMTNLVCCVHTLDYKLNTTNVSNKNIGFTLDKTIIEDIAKGKGPRKYLLTMGLCSWNAGQLESEIESLPPRQKTGSWLKLDYSEDIVFGPKLETLWQDCLGSCIAEKTKSITNKIFNKN